MATRLYPRSFVGSIVEQTGLDEATVLGIVETQRADILAVKAWVDENAGLAGTTAAETLANAWLPGNAPANGAEVIAVAAAARVVIAIEEP